ncbi:E3 ubiquitin-protein ligase JMJ24 isoform X2 [Typha latifolia]|uniref:E3 ubiquitin-protein ligase JMJ24 isoform X2 n=1 Tax=Typha latifolia TaxID=4733 RepID=UPI003C2F4BC3
MEDNVGISEDLRCKRSDGKQWRCSAQSMPDKTVCEKHYIQAKKRAANSALRASLKKARRRSLDDDDDVYLKSKQNDSSPMHFSGGEFAGSIASVKKYRQKVQKGPEMYSPEVMTARGSSARGRVLRPSEELQRDGIQEGDNRVKTFHSTQLNKEAKNFTSSCLGDHSGKSSDSSGGATGLICHQCQRSGRVTWCISCDRRGYCGSCISRWYAEIPVDEVRQVCPACRGICNCRVCLRGDNLIKAKVKEIAGIDKLRYLHRLLVFVLPVLKKIYAEQCFEIGVETRVYGPKVDILRAKLNADEQMCCDCCKIPVFDYHRHCTKCSYDLCLTCCRDIRRASNVVARGESTECQVTSRTKDAATAAATFRTKSSAERTTDKSTSKSADDHAIDFAHLFPTWKANRDGSIPCGPSEAGGCGSSKLILRRILKINWVAKLVKNAEEMVNGCKICDVDNSDKCLSCRGSRSSDSSRSSEFSIVQCSNRDGSSDNLLYCPMLDDIKHEGIGHFQKHWVKGEPIIIKHAFERSLASSWDPLSIWRGIHETIDEKIDDNAIVKAIEYLNQLEVDIELNQFIKGYSEGLRSEDGRPQILKLKDWPPSSNLEEFLLCQRPEFLVNFPLVDFIHSRCGLLNLAAKMPHDTTQPELGPNLLIAYGSHEENGQDGSLSNLQINMGDVVYMLMHTADVHNRSLTRSESDRSERACEELNANRPHGNSHVPDHGVNLDGWTVIPNLAPRERKEKEYASGLRFKEEKIVEHKQCNGPEIASMEKAPDSFNSVKENLDNLERDQAGVIWDVFRRQDVPKLNEYLRACSNDLATTNHLAHAVVHPVYDQTVILDKDQKRILKEEYKIEPWTFKQHVGEAVFIPAGCPFQIKNIQSSVQLVLDFLSPESLGESARMAQEIRCLPNDHVAKLKMFEVGKISLYAASSAIREMQKISVDPEYNSDITFDDCNLTAVVSENLEKITKRRQVLCN